MTFPAGEATVPLHLVVTPPVPQLILLGRVGREEAAGQVPVGGPQAPVGGPQAPPGR